VRPRSGTFRDIASVARGLAAGLRARDVAPGGAVAFQLPNWIEAAATFWTSAFLRAVAVPIVHFYGAKELRGTRRTAPRVHHRRALGADDLPRGPSHRRCRRDRRGGYLTITDRKADLIIRGGENIRVLEVEEVLLGMPAVAQAVVVAAPDPRLGEHAPHLCA
jgi:acyl-CoA synthetase (AMP-forming)/AMP-acid ligase II